MNSVDNLEKLLNAQYEHEKAAKTATWLNKLNVLDFQNRTRAFFSELRKKYNISQKAGHITDSGGALGKLAIQYNVLRVFLVFVL